MTQSVLVHRPPRPLPRAGAKSTARMLACRRLRFGGSLRDEISISAVKCRTALARNITAHKGLCRKEQLPCAVVDMRIAIKPIATDLRRAQRCPNGIKAKVWGAGALEPGPPSRRK